ncbi:MAG: type I 3-dehydroquinate dehydratase, partial [Lachnospiraceae bacterium]|nr:type I 3-dehydroquinate dehydratase [Lachnospiraceae bacterium]
RLSGELFGSAVTFGCVGQASAPGQIEAGRLAEYLEELAEE